MLSLHYGLGAPLVPPRSSPPHPAPSDFDANNDKSSSSVNPSNCHLCLLLRGRAFGCVCTRAGYVHGERAGVHRACAHAAVRVILQSGGFPSVLTQEDLEGLLFFTLSLSSSPLSLSLSLSVCVCVRARAAAAVVGRCWKAAAAMRLLGLARHGAVSASALFSEEEDSGKKRTKTRSGAS